MGLICFQDFRRFDRLLAFPFRMYEILDDLIPFPVLRLRFCSFRPEGRLFSTANGVMSVGSPFSEPRGDSGIL